MSRSEGVGVGSQKVSKNITPQLSYVYVSPLEGTLWVVRTAVCDHLPDMLRLGGLFVCMPAACIFAAPSYQDSSHGRTTGEHESCLYGHFVPSRRIHRLSSVLSRSSLISAVPAASLAAWPLVER